MTNRDVIIDMIDHDCQSLDRARTSNVSFLVSPPTCPLRQGNDGASMTTDLVLEEISDFPLGFPRG